MANTNGMSSYFKQKDAPDEMEENEHNSFYPANLSTIAAENVPEMDEATSTSSARVDALNSFKIDHMVSEFEFWNTNTFNTVARRDSAYRVFQNMMNYMQCMRSANVDPLVFMCILGILIRIHTMIKHKLSLSIILLIKFISAITNAIQIVYFYQVFKAE